jgi:hypothetical protein
MTDLEITKACAEAMGLWPDRDYDTFEAWQMDCYDPLNNDAQAMEMYHRTQDDRAKVA